MKILFSDLDGTLLTDDKKILPEDMQSIDEMLSRGHKFVITTGRPLFSAKNLAKKYGFYKPGFYLVSFNGGLIFDCATEQSILTRRISVDSVKSIMDRAYAYGFHAHTYAGDLVVSEHETPQLKTYCQQMQMEYVVVKDIRSYFGETVPADKVGEPTSPINVVIKPPIKVNVITPLDHSSLLDFRTEMRKTTEGKLFDVFSKPEMLEFSHLKSNKGDAVRFMSEFYNVPLSETIACGDEENDCPMIEAAGVGVAVANASEVARKVANYITMRDNNHSAISEVIKKFVL